MDHGPLPKDGALRKNIDIQPTRILLKLCKLKTRLKEQGH